MRKSQRRKARRKRKAFRITRFLSALTIVVSFFLVLGYIAYMALNVGLFNVKEIQVNGGEIFPAERIKQASGITEGDNILLLDINKARYNIESVLSARDIEIKRVLPGKVVINITENNPVAVVISEGGHYYLDSEGRLMGTTEELGRDTTPLISGFSSYEFGETGAVAKIEPAYKFEATLGMLKLFEQAGLLGELSEISLADGNNYRIITKNGVVFTVKDLNNLKEYFSYVTTVIENGEANQDISLVSGNMPIKKPR